IEESKTNTISFTLSPTGSKDVSDFGDNGGLSVDLKFSKTNVKSIYVTLLNLDTNQIKEERTISSSYFTSSGYTYKKNASYPNYYTELYTEGSIDPGTYRLTFDFLTDNKLLINSFSYIVHVVKGLNSIVTQEIDLNQVYSISYTKNGGSLAEGEVEIAKYTRLNEVILPRLARDNYTFIGWYDNSSFEGEPVTKIEKGSTGNKSFYARFVSSVLYVNAANGDDSHDGSSGSSTKALQTLGAALNKMALTADGKKLDYTIYLTGTFTGEQTIADISATETLPASSITLAGYSGVDSDGVPKDVLDGGFTESSKGSTLTISTTVPVIIKNLKITGGYAEEGKGGGITLSQGTSLTLESGEISGNSGVSSSAAVYVSASSTKGAVFTMNGGTICNNTGNGVCVHDGSKPASFNMTGGSITGNTGYGVWLPASGGYYAPFSMSGSALVTADNIVEVPNRIIVAGLLTGDSPVVTIKPSSYSESKIVYLADGLTDTSILASASEKIAVAPQGDAPWVVDSNGNLKAIPACAQINGSNCYFVDDLISKITAADSATTILLYNTLTASDIGKTGTSGTILHAIKSNSNSGATFALSVDSTDGKIALTGDASSMFYECSKITSLDMSGFDTSAVTDMNYMFYECSGLTSLVLTGFTTASVSDMRYMFYGCSSLTTLDVSTFEIIGDASLISMFENCSGLTTIYAASDANWYAEDRSSSYMFRGCTSLTGYNVDNVDSQYAHVGDVNDKTGYFTAN
ncbi:MAG: BspA family leucine-rich repeat surface protein, partial [Treponema sp.]|nr:BspA family leucine-rich repeat surface protein [Treponema sp.]